MPQSTEESKKCQEVTDYFKGICKRTPAGWPSNKYFRSNPFAFPWHGEEFREQFTHLMVTDFSGRTNGPAKDLLRWLLYRFRHAQFRRDNPPHPFRDHRWVWHKNVEVKRKTGLSDYQLRTALACLKERGLVVQAYDSAVSNFRPHYRPTNDLFRAAHLVCLLTNDDYINTKRAYHSRSEFRDWMSAILEYHYEELRLALLTFSNSNNRGRAIALEASFAELIGEVNGCLKAG